MDMTMANCREFVSVLASDAPAPGGGGAAALVGAIGTALGNMVGSLKVYIYYASSDTRMHVAETDIGRLCDYLLNTPADPLRSPDCVKQRCELIAKNLAFLKK